MTSRSAALRAAWALGLAAVLAGCDSTFFGKPEGPPLPGERISVLKMGTQLVPDEALASLQVRLPRPWRNTDWPQAGGYTGHAMHHLALPDDLKVAWRADIGTSASRDQRMVNDPVVADSRIFTIDAGSRLSAFSVADGKRLWSEDLTPEEEEADLFGGGLGYWQGTLYVTTPYAKVLALDPANGERRWEVSLPAPMHAPPTISDGRVFVQTVDDHLFVLAADDGRQLWDYEGVSEPTTLLGGPSPAVLGTVAVVAFSSGEVFAFQVETGRVLWSESLGGAGLVPGSASTLSDIRGSPVIDRDLVFAASYAGTLAALDLRRGGRAWDAGIGSAQQPWVAGDYLYVLTNDAELVCMRRTDGRIRWVTQLPRFQDPEEKSGPIYWSGPVLGGDRLIVTSSAAEAYSVSPYTGAILGRFELPARTFLPPIIADGTLYFLSDDAELIALR
ncbi:MAG: PQQ-binding-like beta-propeller repeat protein [Rhodospirillaceae bacterium]|nr:PQQ-binding-like beta-propeller repeat protein [Rhodospirillaceae bacterium]